MLGLPKSTEVNKQLPKKAIYSKFQLNTVAKAKIDADISRITIVNEISSERINIADGENIKSFFVISVSLKQKDFDQKNIATLSKLVPQNILFVLEYQDEVKLAINHTRLLQSEWMQKENASIELKGMNFDIVWENIVAQVGDIYVKEGNTLEEQIIADEQQAKLLKEIARLEKQVHKEKQLNVQMKLNSELKKLKKELEVLE